MADGQNGPILAANIRVMRAPYLGVGSSHFVGLLNRSENTDGGAAIIGKKPSKDKGKDTELMPDYDMTGKNVSDNVLEFSDDSDNESEEPAKEPEEIEEEDGTDV